MEIYGTIPPPRPKETNTVFVPVELELRREAGTGDVYQRPEQSVFASMRRAQQTFLDVAEARWAREIARRSGIPVGVQIDRRDLSGTRGIVPQVAGQAASRPPPVLSPSIAGRGSPSFIPQLQQQQEANVDLGAIMGGLTQAVDIYGQVMDIRRGTTAAGVRQPTVVQPQFVSSPMPQVGMGLQPAFSPLALAGPAVAGVGRALSSADRIGTAIAGLGLGLAADEIALIADKASKVKCRRRRRRLATHSDIKDLAALKAVLGSGKAFDTWIATRKM